MTEKSSVLLYVDAMFGKLGRFLRILGFDTEIADPKLKDPEILEHILKVNRILITRDHLFYEITQKRLKKENLPEEMVLFLNEEELHQQLHKIFQHIGFKPEKLLWNNLHDLKFQPRCSLCNSELDVVEKKQILEKLSMGTATTFNHFWQCSNLNCNQIYWRGRHWQDIGIILKKVISADDLS
ncbi:Mut7-C RNAse domain-containing protein [Candidatus Lokiarchaeum ossiferum]|uniref:Mut7-C RNAse domain-containing protein n=1 Tax=Candidatus Lokiarchaeum ossiferum TaxID=2951803 RepID=UPI00352C9E61